MKKGQQKADNQQADKWLSHFVILVYFGVKIKIDTTANVAFTHKHTQKEVRTNRQSVQLLLSLAVVDLVSRKLVGCLVVNRTTPAVIAPVQRVCSESAHTFHYALRLR